MLTRFQSQPPPQPGLRLERLLLGVAGGFIFVNVLALSLLDPDLTHWLLFGVWFTVATVGTTLLQRYLPRRDPMLFPLVMFLSGWGLLIIDRLLPRFAHRQMVWLVIALAALLLVALYPHVLRWLRVYRYLWLFTGLLLLTGTIVFGRNPSQIPEAPQLWLGLGDINFQPSEALKILLIAFLASYLAEQYPALRAAHLSVDRRTLAFSPRLVGPILLMWGLSIVLLVWQRDLGAAMLFFVVFLLLLYVASGRSTILIGGAALTLVAGIIAYNSFAVVRLRIDIWLNPWPEAEDRAYQIVQSLQAFAAGGIFGQGIGQGSPQFVPVAHSDFVFAALAEEWGLLGVITLVACLMVFVARGIRIAAQQRGKAFRMLMAIGLTTLIGAQSCLIMGGTLGVLPLTGVTLPYLSYGGSSLLMSFISAGLLIRLSGTRE